ncbi:MAG: SRPBCC domain-containing protein [Proteobacteria bacterium]|nr:SRPBCC domain-containing protein [Pseudomonadota bacterium]
MLPLLALTAALLLAPLEPVAAPPSPKADSPKSQSDRDPKMSIIGVITSGDSSSAIVETVIDAPVKRVWEVFTTSEGFTSLGPAKANVDFRVGGLIKSTYDPNGSLDDNNHIENEIIAFDPERMISFRIHKPPATFPYPNAWKSTWSVVTLEPVGPDRTRLRLAMLGFGKDEESQKMHKFFEVGNAKTMQSLRQKLGSDEARSKSEKAWKLLTGLVGDSWKGCSTLEDGQKVCATTLWTYGPREKSLIFSIWLNEASTKSPHIHQVISPEPATGAIVYTAVDDGGNIMSGHVTLTTDDTVTMDWNSEHADGAKFHQFVTLQITAPEAYIQRNYGSAADLAANKPWIEVTYRHPGPAPSAPGSSAEPATPTPGKPTSMIDTNLFEADGRSDLIVKTDAVIDAPTDKVFQAWTTAEGIRSFLDIDSKVELRVGGPFELYFGDTTAPEGQRGSEGCQVLCFIPGRMLSFSWNAPPKFAAERARRSCVTLLFSPVDHDKTHVELTQSGFGTGGQWPQVHQYFSSAWPQVLDALKEYFQSQSSGAARSK